MHSFCMVCVIHKPIAACASIQVVASAHATAAYDSVHLLVCLQGLAYNEHPITCVCFTDALIGTAENDHAYTSLQ